MLLLLAFDQSATAPTDIAELQMFVFGLQPLGSLHDSSPLSACPAILAFAACYHNAIAIPDLNPRSLDLHIRPVGSSDLFVHDLKLAVTRQISSTRKKALHILVQGQRNTTTDLVLGFRHEDVSVNRAAILGITAS